MVKPIKPDCPVCAGTGKIPRGEYLKELRDAKKLTLAEIAERARVSKQFLSQIERGEKRATPEVRRAYGEL